MADDKSNVAAATHTGVTGVDELDVIESSVTRMLGSADATLLEEVYNEINLTIPPSATGNANKLLRVLNRYLNSQTVVGVDDEGLSVLKAVFGVLNRGNTTQNDPAVMEGVKTEDKDGSSGSNGKTKVSGGDKPVAHGKTVVKAESGMTGTKLVYLQEEVPWFRLVLLALQILIQTLA